MKKIVFIIIFLLTTSKLLACECTHGFVGKHFLNNINSFDAIILVEAISEPIEEEHNLIVKKVYKGDINESETLILNNSFCSLFLFEEKGTRLILGLNRANFSYE